MNSRSYALAIAAVFCAGSGPVMGDPVMSIKKQDLVGAWRYETSYIESPDGHHESHFGERPQGLFIILANGWYSHIIMREESAAVQFRRYAESHRRGGAGRCPWLGPKFRHLDA